MNVDKTLKICSNLDNILEQYGNINFISKDELYTLIDYIRNCFGIFVKKNEPFNVTEFFKDNFTDIIECHFNPFNDKKIGGFLVKNNYPEKSHIVINSSKEPIYSLFDLTHELIHFLLHPENRQHYISTSLCNVDNFEWQANEGAAELLVPYKKFIPLFVKYIKNCRNYSQYIELIKRMSDIFIVSTAVIEYRVSGLKYEINQYENGINIDELEFLSQRAQEELGINIKSYNDIFKNKRTNLKNIISELSLKFESVNTDSTSKTYKNSENVDAKYNYDIHNWEDILDYFKTSGKIVLYTNLQNTQMIPLNDDTISINFIDGLSNFGKVILSKKSNLEAIKEQIDFLFNKNMHIQFINKSKDLIDIDVDKLIS